MALTISGSAIGPWDSIYGGGYTTTAGVWSRGSSAGYVKLENGLLLQYGQCQTGGLGGRYDSFITFPMSFPIACSGIAINEASAGNWNNQSTYYTSTAFSLGGFYLQAVWVAASNVFYGTGLGGQYIAVGY
jgi:hypothetical protein